jgi:NitT/TauT family transport system substrate-binding protein
MITGLDLKEFSEILVRHRDSLYPETVDIDLDAAIHRSAVKCPPSV